MNEWNARSASCEATGPNVYGVGSYVDIPGVIENNVSVDDEEIDGLGVNVDQDGPVALNGHVVSSFWDLFIWPH